MSNFYQPYYFFEESDTISLSMLGLPIFYNSKDDLEVVKNLKNTKPLLKSIIDEKVK